MKGPQASSPTFSSKQGQLCSQTSCLRSLSSQVFQTPKDKERLHSLSGQPLELHCCWRKNILPFSQTKLLICFNLRPWIPALLPPPLWRDLFHSLSDQDIGTRGCCSVCPKLSLLQAEQAQLNQSLLTERVLQPPTIMMVLVRNLLQSTAVCLGRYWEVSISDVS